MNTSRKNGSIARENRTNEQTNQLKKKHTQTVNALNSEMAFDWNSNTLLHCLLLVLSCFYRVSSRLSSGSCQR